MEYFYITCIHPSTCIQVSHSSLNQIRHTLRRLINARFLHSFAFMWLFSRSLEYFVTNNSIWGVLCSKIPWNFIIALKYKLCKKYFIDFFTFTDLIIAAARDMNKINDFLAQQIFSSLPFLFTSSSSSSW
jgi:hypothetical protein